jgi:hypothetical protein
MTRLDCSSIQSVQHCKDGPVSRIAISPFNHSLLIDHAKDTAQETISAPVVSSEESKTAHYFSLPRIVSSLDSEETQLQSLGIHFGAYRMLPALLNTPIITPHLHFAATLLTLPANSAVKRDP